MPEVWQVYEVKSVDALLRDICGEWNKVFGDSRTVTGEVGFGDCGSIVQLRANSINWQTNFT
jgi:hypothetical protein